MAAAGVTSSATERRKKSYAMLRTCCWIHFKGWQNAPQVKHCPYWCLRINKGTAELVILGRMLSVKTVKSLQKTIGIIRFWHVLTRFDHVSQTSELKFRCRSSMVTPLWVTTRLSDSMALVVVEPQLRSIDLALQSWRAPYSADADCKMLGSKC